MLIKTNDSRLHQILRLLRRLCLKLRKIKRRGIPHSKNLGERYTLGTLPHWGDGIIKTPTSQSGSVFHCTGAAAVNKPVKRTREQSIWSRNHGRFGILPGSAQCKSFCIHAVDTTASRRLLKSVSFMSFIPLRPETGQNHTDASGHASLASTKVILNTPSPFTLTLHDDENKMAKYRNFERCKQQEVGYRLCQKGGLLGLDVTTNNGSDSVILG
ncbi:hypothetical protein ARMSODRAFT_980801 [Armillaria solidipes]|uniref:Uncharacterized protein n=1 Tax=Armillaria solidipes TaxID=1076256 RepID=A0A2H3AUA1_9AGAR|nr:hypothetical protein ARMSODRAFT_980801 [Armillaria solidipes]